MGQGVRNGAVPAMGGMSIVDSEQHLVDPFADAADLLLKGVEIDTAWLGIRS